MSIILAMRTITKDFNGVRALDSVSLDVERGQVHAICGENGAGKSTLMKVLSGVYPHGTYAGEIHFDGAPATFKTINESEAAGIVIIHQELALSPFLSIAENIFLGNEVATRGVIDWDKTNLEATKLLARVGLDEKPTTPVRELGVGKQQLVEISKALSKRVKLLILDEPTAALNDDDSAHLLDLISSLRGQGVTSIIISHKLKEIRKIADTVTILRDGKTIETFSMSESDATESRIIKSMVGRELDNLFPPRTPVIGDELFRIDNWTVHHPVEPGRIVIDNASFNVRAGEIVGFAGLMGAGRTELAMSIFGRSYGSQITGDAFKAGVPISLRTVSEAIRNGLAYATEDRKRYGLNLLGGITVNITAAALGKLARFGIVDRFAENGVADSYRRQMNIKAASLSVPTGNLSGGNQQKVVLSKWVYSGPDVLILDEPTRGIDVGAKYEIYTIINELAAHGKAIILISSELPELLGMSDRIYAISEGRITGEVTRADANQETLMHYMTAGKD